MPQLSRQYKPLRLHGILNLDDKIWTLAQASAPNKKEPESSFLVDDLEASSNSNASGSRQTHQISVDDLI